MTRTDHDNTTGARPPAGREDVQQRLDHAAAALRQAASRQPQQIGVCLYCLRAVDLLLDAGAQPDTDHSTVAAADSGDVRGDTGDDAEDDTGALIRAALTTLGGLPAAEFARAPIHQAARAARRALALTGEPRPDGVAPAGDGSSGTAPPDQR